MYGYAHCSAREQAGARRLLSWGVTQAPLPRPRPPHRLPATLAAAVSLPSAGDAVGSPGDQGVRGKARQGPEDGRGRGPGAAGSSDRCLCVLLGARPGPRVPRVTRTEKTGHVFTAEGTNSTGSAALLPPPPARTAGHALAPSHPPFLSWPERCSADGMRQRLLERRFVPCWADARGACMAPGGGEAEPGQGHCWAAWPSPGGGASPLSAPRPARAPRHSSGPPPSPLQT